MLPKDELIGVESIGKAEVERILERIELVFLCFVDNEKHGNSPCELLE